MISAASSAWKMDSDHSLCVWGGDWGVLHRCGKTPAAVRHAQPDHGAAIAMRQAMTPGRFAPVFRARALLDNRSQIAPGMRPAHASGVSR